MTTDDAGAQNRLKRLTAHITAPESYTAALERHLDKSPPPLLSHYTGQRGLLGILTCRKLWASMVYYLNDAQEYAYALTLANALWVEFKPDLDDARCQMISSALETLASFSNVNAFVCSLATDEDSLDMWRAYCPSTGGYSISFEAGALREVMRPNKFLLAACIYDIAEQRRLLRSLLEDIATHCDPKERSEDPDELSESELATLESVKLIAWCAPLLKHPAFHRESEWRLMRHWASITDRDVRFREGPSTLVPYVECPISDADDDTPIRHIVVGPTPHPTLAQAAIKRLLINRKLTGIEVRVSKVPYRTW